MAAYHQSCTVDSLLIGTSKNQCVLGILSTKHAVNILINAPGTIYFAQKDIFITRNFGPDYLLLDNYWSLSFHTQLWFHAYLVWFIDADTHVVA